jgi:hypothetical protein
MILPAIGHDQQHLPRIVGSFHPVQAEIDCVQQRCSSICPCIRNCALNLLNRTRKIGQQLRTVSKANHKEFVFRVCATKKPDNRIERAVDFSTHATTRIEEDTQRHGCIFCGEMAYDLPVVPVINAEILLTEADHWLVLSIRHGNWNQHKIHISFEMFALFARRKDSAHRRTGDDLRRDVNVRSIDLTEAERDNRTEDECSGAGSYERTYSQSADSLSPYARRTCGQDCNPSLDTPQNRLDVAANCDDLQPCLPAP